MKSKNSGSHPKNSDAKQSQPRITSANILLKWGTIIGLFLAVCIVFDSQMHRFWVFDQNNLQSIVQAAINRRPANTRELFSFIVANISTQYPGHIRQEENWLFNNAGGAMGSMWILHASISEYLIIFGTPVGTEGHSGRHMADDYFIILEGEQWAFSEGQLEREVYKPGVMHHLKRGDVQQYKINDHCWALEYARGWIPAMFPFGIADTLFSTVDFQNFAKLSFLYGKSILIEVMQGKL